MMESAHSAQQTPLMTVPPGDAYSFALQYKFTIKPVKDASVFLDCKESMEHVEGVQMGSFMIQQLKPAHLTVEPIKASSMELADALMVLLSFWVLARSVPLELFTTHCFKPVCLHALEIAEFLMENVSVMMGHMKLATNVELVLKAQPTTAFQKPATLLVSHVNKISCSLMEYVRVQGHT